MWTPDFMWSYSKVRCKYLHSLFTAAEQPSISELQSFLGTCALLSFILQTTKVALIDCERLEGLLWTQVTLLKQMNSIKNTYFSEKQTTVSLYEIYATYFPLLTATGFVFSQSLSKSVVRFSTALSSCTIFICRFATCCWIAVSLRFMMSLKAPHSPSMLSM